MRRLEQAEMRFWIDREMDGVRDLVRGDGNHYYLGYVSALTRFETRFLLTDEERSAVEKARREMFGD